MTAVLREPCPPPSTEAVRRRARAFLNPQPATVRNAITRMRLVEKFPEGQRPSGRIGTGRSLMLRPPRFPASVAPRSLGVSPAPRFHSRSRRKRKRRYVHLGERLETTNMLGNEARRFRYLFPRFGPANPVADAQAVGSASPNLSPSSRNPAREHLVTSKRTDGRELFERASAPCVPRRRPTPAPGPDSSPSFDNLVLGTPSHTSW